MAEWIMDNKFSLGFCLAEIINCDNSVNRGSIKKEKKVYRIPVKVNSKKQRFLVLFIRLCSYDVGYALRSRAWDEGGESSTIY